MLKFLITSRARRQLLVVLWGNGQAGSVKFLAEQAGVSRASAQKELQDMWALSIVVRDRAAFPARYCANHEHPQAAALQSLLAKS